MIFKPINLISNSKLWEDYNTVESYLTRNKSFTHNLLGQTLFMYAVNIRVVPFSPTFCTYKPYIVYEVILNFHISTW